MPLLDEELDQQYLDSLRQNNATLGVRRDQAVMPRGGSAEYSNPMTPGALASDTWNRFTGLVHGMSPENTVRGMTGAAGGVRIPEGAQIIEDDAGGRHFLFLDGTTQPIGEADRRHGGLLDLAEALPMAGIGGGPAGTVGAGARRGAPRAVARQADIAEGVTAPAAPARARPEAMERPNSPAAPSPHAGPDLPDIQRINDWTTEDFHRYGTAHGTNNLGSPSNAEWQASLRPYETPDGRTITVPGGHESAEPFTYYDMAHLQAQGINPNDLPDVVHRGIHNRIIRTMTPNRDLEPHEIFNQLAFAQVSPNQPLTPNLLASQAVDAKHPRLTAAQGQNMTDLDRWADSIPWRYDDANRPDLAARRAQSARITESLGIQASERGGSGVSGNADYTNIAELAQRIRDNPDFFRFRASREGGATDAENWGRFVERLMNNVPGLGAKTGSFGAVWQAPERAQISAMDRHMAGLLSDDVFSIPRAQKALVDRGQKFARDRGMPPEAAPRTREQFEALPGGRGEFLDVALGQIGNLPGARYRVAGTGEINPRVPEHLREHTGREPEHVSWLGNAYQRGLDANAARAAYTPGIGHNSNQSVFANQWMLWDRARNRLDPHLQRFPGLDRLPRMDQQLMRDRQRNYGEAGYFNYGGGAQGGEATVLPPVRPMRGPGHAAYWAIPPAVAVGGGGLLGDDQ